MTTFFRSLAITCSSSTFTYKGMGYSYNLRRSVKTGTTAKLRCTRDLMERFRQLLRKVDPIGYVGLDIASIGGGWYDLFTLDDNRDHLVVKFLRRLNIWVLQKLEKTYENPVKKSNHYYLTVRQFQHSGHASMAKPAKVPSIPKKQPIRPEPKPVYNAVPATFAKLQELASRFCHTNSRAVLA